MLPHSLLLRVPNCLLLFFVTTASLTGSVSAEGIGETLSWNLRDEFRVYPELTNPMPDAHGFGTVWHFLRTTGHEDSSGGRLWPRDGRYVALRERQSQRFFHPRAGWIARSYPPRPPAVGRNREAEKKGLEIAAGDIVIEPGPEAAVIIGWRSPVFGVAEIQGSFEHVDNGCDGRGQIRWYVERGPAPAPESGFRSLALAAGSGRYGTRTQRGAFRVLEQQVQPGDFVYFIADAVADGTDLPHDCDLTRFDVTITVTEARRPPLPGFESDVLPILAKNCHNCHGTDTQNADLDLRSEETIVRGGQHGPAVLPGHPDRSVLVDRILGDEMPPANHAPLSLSEKETLWQWVRGLSRSPQSVTTTVPQNHIPGVEHEHWAFQTPRKLSVPTPRDGQRVRTAIDAFLLARLEAEDLSFSSDVDRTSLIRRASFDLLGLPPRPEDVAAFVGDESPDAHERLIDRLLSSPHYGERWGRHWLDVVGYVDTAGDEGSLDFFLINEGIWRFRDYVVRSLNQNKPFDVFITEQLAGDEIVDWKSAKMISPEIFDRLVATGYLRTVEDGSDGIQFGLAERYKVLYRLMDMVSKSLLGLTFECARCHDHKYEPISQRDYYRLMSCFETAYNAQNGWIRAPKRVLSDLPFAEQQALDQFNEGVETAAQVLRDERTRINQDAAIQGEKKKSLIDDLTVKIESIEAKKKLYNKVQAVWDVGPPPVSRILRGGQWNDPGIRVDPGFPAVLSSATTSRALRPDDTVVGSSGRRLSLARWLTRAEHPLTARVVVNRVWHHHFGRGIVSTPGNFGRSGSPPSHPELLDWLARDFVENGWNFKRLHRLIMTSTAYRQSSRVSIQNSQGQQIDAENKLLWRRDMRRLESESVRDSVLVTSGRLDRRLGGAPIPLTAPASGLSTVKVDSTRSSHLRRSLYLLARRNYPLSFLETFDAPIIAVNCTRREPTATVLQSLTFLNSSFVLDEARYLAGRVFRRSGGVAARQVRWAYLLTLSRPPVPEEAEKCLLFLSEQTRIYGESESPSGESREGTLRALGDLCHMLLCSNEFLYVE